MSGRIITTNEVIIQFHWYPPIKNKYLFDKQYLKVVGYFIYALNESREVTSWNIVKSQVLYI